MRRVRIGPSVTKVVLDALMLLTIARRALAGGYDAIHSHEEMGLVGVWLAQWLGIPHLYDMHSSLPQQLSNFKYSGSRLLRRVVRRGRGPDGQRLATSSSPSARSCRTPSPRWAPASGRC